MKSFVVKVTETLEKDVLVFEENADKAKKAVIDEYMNGDLVLTADDYHGFTTFQVTERKNDSSAD